ncbi:hypothetical protein ACJX0J_007534, partial [Zea mays]
GGFEGLERVVLLLGDYWVWIFYIEKVMHKFHMPLNAQEEMYILIYAMTTLQHTILLSTIEADRLVVVIYLANDENFHERTKHIDIEPNANLFAGLSIHNSLGLHKYLRIIAFHYAMNHVSLLMNQSIATSHILQRYNINLNPCQEKMTTMAIS